MALGYLEIENLEGNTPSGKCVGTIPKALVTRCLGFRYLVNNVPTNWPGNTYVEMKIGSDSISRIRLDRLAKLQNMRTPAGTSNSTDAAVIVGKNLTYPLISYDPEYVAPKSVFMWYFGNNVRSDQTDFSLWLGQGDLADKDEVTFTVDVPATAGGRVEMFHQSVDDPTGQFKIGTILAYRENTVLVDGAGPRDLTAKFDRQNYLAMLFTLLTDEDGLVIKAGNSYLVNEEESMIDPGKIAGCFNGSWDFLTLTLQGLFGDNAEAARMVVFDPDERLSSRWPKQAVAPVITINSADAGTRNITVVSQLLYSRPGAAA